MLNKCPICGPKMSIFCAVISLWGIVFLTILGIAFHFGAGILLEDLPSEALELNNKTGAFITPPLEEMKDRALQCWIAAGLYGVTFVLALLQYRWGNR